MKVVTNRCYGGFGLSIIAQKEYLKLLGKDMFFYTQTKYKYKDGIDEYIKVPESEANAFCYTLTKDFGDIINNMDPIISDGSYFYYNDIKRTDPNLITVIESLGEKSFGDCAKLEITEIPDGIEYEIDEYDGYESIHEKHRSW